MNIWDNYESRISANGSYRKTIIDRTQKYILDKIASSASKFTVNIDGVKQDVAILNTDNLNEKFIYSLPGSDIEHGGLVEWMDNFWLVTEKDAATEVYTRAKMVQCNYLLRWIDKDSSIHEQWCIIEDGTKYLTGEYSDRDFVTTRGDSRLGMTIAKNEHTTKFNRSYRFLIDDDSGDSMLAYELTKPFKLSNIYNGKGVFKFVLQEVNTTEEDNLELRIANYYKYLPKAFNEQVPPDVIISPEENTNDTGRQVWL